MLHGAWKEAYERQKRDEFERKKAAEPQQPVANWFDDINDKNNIKIEFQMDGGSNSQTNSAGSSSK